MSLRLDTAIMTFAAGVMIGVGVLLPQSGGVGAQPVATPALAECTVAPLPSPVWDGEEIPEPTAPVSVDGPFTPPTGTPVDEETLAAVSGTIAESLACQNDGDVARMLALFTPDAVRSFFSGPRGFDAESVEATIAAGAEPLSSERVVTLDSIDDVVLLPDGRAGATVTTSAGDVEYVDFLFLAQGLAADGTDRWLIDGSVAIDGQTQVTGDATAIP